jgi:hypothetical protein
MLHRTISLAICAAAFWNSAAQTTKEAPESSISITTVPAWDPGGPDKTGSIAGTVRTTCGNCMVVLYAHGDVWYVQPWANQPFTKISNGKWSNQTHLGAEYAALLVKPGFQAPTQTGVLPSGANVLATTTERGRR